MSCKTRDTILESCWVDLATAATTWSLLAVALARLGLFRWWAVLAISLLACASGWALWRTRSPQCRFDRREALFLLLLLAAGLVLFARPAEHLPQMGDSSIYPNTASKLIETGGLTYRYAPLDGLSPQQKELFYVPSDEQLPYIDIQSYEGLLYGAYYVMDLQQNSVVASRPPLAITWMGLFGLLAGPRGMLYVTPFFGIASLLAVYFLGKRLFDAGAGALAVLWLLISFPQLYFSRTPYAEVVGQFFVLTAMYALAAYLQTASVRHIVLGVAALTAGFSARLDVILFAPLLLFFVFLLLLRREGRALAACGVSAAVGVGFTLWTANRPYLGASGELLLLGQLRFLRQLNSLLLAGISLAGLLGVVGLTGLLSRLSPIRRERLIRWGVLLVVVVGVGYNLHIRPHRAEYVGAGEEAIATHSEELMAVAAQYMSYPFFWLAALGMIGLLWQRRVCHDQLFFASFVAFFAAGFFWKYTTARIYPAALRRLVPEVLPGCALLAAFAVRQLARRGRPWRCGGVAIAGLVAVLLVGVSGRYWFHQGALGARSTLEAMADHLPKDSVALFEPREPGSFVGWFAAPLWSFYQRDALLLNAGNLDGQALQGALCHWQGQGRAVYVVSQNDPSTWWPDGFRADQEGEISWKSSIIGQSPRFPPYVWHFSCDFVVYRLETPVSCLTDGAQAVAMLAALP